MTTDYGTRCAQASKEQKIDAIVEELKALGIHATSEQTGGFTMCAYIELEGGKYIYANPYGASVYNSDDYEDDVNQYDEPQDASVIAQDIKNYIATAN